MTRRTWTAAALLFCSGTSALVYQTVWLQSMSPQGALPVYIQPVWRFSGHYEDGSIFDIRVQALTDGYLK